MKSALLIDICEVISRGIAPKYTESEEGIIILNQKCIRNHVLSFEQARLHDNSSKPVKPEKVIQDGDILINSTGHGTLGRTVLAEGITKNVTVDSHITIVRPNASIIYPRYLSYLLGMLEEELIALATGTSGQTELPRVLLQNFKITFEESLDEQQRIVKVLDAAFKKINNATILTQQNLHNSTEIFTSKVREIFSSNSPDDWQFSRLIDVCEDKPQYGLSIKMNERHEGFRIFRMGDIYNGSLHDNGNMKYADISSEEFQKYKLTSGDLLFNRTNSSELVGKTGIFELKGDYCFASYLVRVRVNKVSILPEFAAYFMNSDVFLTSVRSKASKAVNQANFNATKLSNEIVPHPISIDVQRELVSELDQLWDQTQRLLNLYRKKLESMHNLKSSLLIKAFNGVL